MLAAASRKYYYNVVANTGSLDSKAWINNN